MTEFLRPTKVAIVLGLTGLLSLRCETPAYPPGNIPVFLIPMNVGNAWYYELDEVDSLGNVLSSTNRSITVQADTLVGGDLWFDFFPGGYRMNRPDGVWRLQPTPFLEFPFAVGDSVLHGDGNSYMKLLSKGTRVKVPAGTFVCYEYAQTSAGNGSLLNKFYLALSLGIVRKDLLDGTSQAPDTIAQLITYTILPGSS